MPTEITLYHQAGCPQCSLFKKLLDQKHIQYKSELNITSMLEKGITHTPVLEIDGTRLTGKAALDWIRNFKE